jgi:hypothetical protein
VFFKDENEGIFDDDIRDDRGQKTLTRLKQYNIKGAIYNWASSWSEIKTNAHGTNTLAMKNRSLILKA